MWWAPLIEEVLAEVDEAVDGSALLGVGPPLSAK